MHIRYIMYMKRYADSKHLQNYVYIRIHTYFMLYKVMKILSLLLSSLSYVTAIPLPGRHPDHLESIFGILRVP